MTNETSSDAPPAASRLVVSARLTRAGTIPTPESILPYRSALVVNEYEVVQVTGGAYPHPTIQVAQWAIRDGRLVEARRLAGAAFNLTVERYDAHPELEGERLVSDQLARAGECLVPDLARVVLDPAGARIVLRQLTLG